LNGIVWVLSIPRLKEAGSEATSNIDTMMIHDVLIEYGTRLIILIIIAPKIS
jgi:hypothetical protein